MKIVRVLIILALVFVSIETYSTTGGMPIGQNSSLELSAASANYVAELNWSALFSTTKESMNWFFQASLLIVVNTLLFLSIKRNSLS